MHAPYVWSSLNEGRTGMFFVDASRTFFGRYLGLSPQTHVTAGKLRLGQATQAA